MYYQNYEDYMRSVLGYPTTHEVYEHNYSNCNYQDTRQLEELYPKIYRIINPIVCEVCNKCNKPVDRNVLESMINEVSQRLEFDNEISIKTNIDNRTTQKEVIDNRISKTNTSKNVMSEQSKKVQETQDRQTRPQNPLLNDIIRILILNQLLQDGSPKNPQRPPFPGGQGRPPFIGNPGMPPRPRDYNEFY